MKIAVDTGGTFTDFLWKEGKTFKFFKVFSTPKNPAIAILQGLKHFSPKLLIHGTTVATNAFLERKGGEIVLFTTQGFEDIIFIGRQNRAQIYNFFTEKSKAFIAPENILGLPERIGPKGEVIKPLTKDSIKKAIQFFQDKKLTTCAITFLHSYANPSHERVLKEALSQLPGIDISASFEILPEFREYERTSTTAMNAYLTPVIKKYLFSLRNELPNTRIYLQQSNGGYITIEEAVNLAIHTILSGPAGGVFAGRMLGKILGFEKIITFDMGGTSTDVCLLNKSLPFTKNYILDGFPVGIPVIDIHTIGAGGGSIAYIDAGGILKVGPQSAGADPGPACYGKGLFCTVTDANLLLGRLRGDYFCGGSFKLDEKRAFQAISQLSERLGISPLETALGIIEIINTHMARALNKVSVERGFDPREFVLVSFGGAGGLHTCALAKKLEISKIIVPKLAGAFTTLGLFWAPYLKDFSQTVFLPFTEKEKIKEALKNLYQKVLSYLKGRGYLIEKFKLEFMADVRYIGQGFELTIPWEEDLRAVFEEAHLKNFGFILKDYPIEIVTLRVRVLKETPWEEFEIERKTPSFYSFKTKVFTDLGWEEIPVINWEVLKEGEKVPGPALIIEDFTTFYLEKGFILEVKENQTLLVERI